MYEKNDDRAKVAELVDRAQSAMLTTMSADGDHLSRPMAVQETEFDGDLWFFTYDDSDKARQIASHPKVNVSLANDKKSEWTSIAGTAEALQDWTLTEEVAGEGDEEAGAVRSVYRFLRGTYTAVGPKVTRAELFPNISVGDAPVRGAAAAAAKKAT